MINLPTLNLIAIKIEDQPKLFSLMKEIYPPAYSHFWADQGDWYLDLCYSIENLKEELSRERSHYYFIEWNQETIGILKFDYPFSPRQIDIPNAIKLHRLYLHPKTHGKGFAPEIMNYIEGLAKSKNLDAIWLEAMEKQEQAKRFYKKMGYSHLLTYQLDFKRFLPGYHSIEILQKKLI